MQILTMKEICKLTRLSVETIRKWRKAGTFPAPKTGTAKGKLLWLLSDIEHWMGKDR